MWLVTNIVAVAFLVWLLFGRERADDLDEVPRERWRGTTLLGWGAALLLMCNGVPSSVWSPAPSVRPPTELPAAPFALDPPTPPGPLPAVLAESDARTLAELAHEAHAAGDTTEAALFSAHALAREPGVIHPYDAACHQASDGRVDAAVYWLQRAAREEGVDTASAAADGDLARVRASDRWAALAPFLVASQEYWLHSGVEAAPYVLGRSEDDRMPALVWLHGLGDEPDGLVTDLTPFAVHQGIALIGVSATLPRAPRSFVWSEDLDPDATRIRDALDAIERSETVRFGPIVLMGFSQGAHLADALLARGEPWVDGVVSMSPGWRRDASAHDALRPGPAARERRRAVITVGEGEAPATVAQARADAQALEAGGALVELRVVPDQHAHTFPRDFARRIGDWFTFASGGPDPVEP